MSPFADTISFDPPDEDGQFFCEVRSPKGRFVKVAGSLGDPEPTVTGDVLLVENLAISQNLWSAASEYSQSLAFAEVAAKDEIEKVAVEPENAEVPDDNDIESAEESVRQIAKDHFEAAKRFAKLAQEIAALTENLGEERTEGWCSNCVSESFHRKVDGAKGIRDIYLCGDCGVPTVRCSAPKCSSMAVKANGTRKLVPFCAEHRHDIPSFERAGDNIADLSEWEDLVRYDKTNMAKVTGRTAMGVAAVSAATGAAFVAAPAIGGIIGSQLLGLSGAAATNAGLAALGGGSVAAGGLGMAGGTYVVAATGGLLGGVYGDRILGSYINEDSSFKIEKIREGLGAPVVIARGFLNEKSPDWYKAVKATEDKYPDSPVYQLSWGSKELRHLLNVAGIQGAGAAGKKVLAKAVGKASVRMAAKMNPVAPVLAAGTLVGNPWHTAVNRANCTGTALAALLAKSEQEDFILVGHSLGGRVMITCATALAGLGNSGKIRDIHLMGAAMGRGKTWRPLSEAVTGTVHNYWSANDSTLKYMYTAAMFGKGAVGGRGFDSDYTNIVDHDVSDVVTDHKRYYDDVAFA